MFHRKRFNDFEINGEIKQYGLTSSTDIIATGSNRAQVRIFHKLFVSFSIYPASNKQFN